LRADLADEAGAAPLALSGIEGRARHLRRRRLAGRTLDASVTPATSIVSIASGQQCDPSGLPAGTATGFTVTATGTGSYRLDELDVA
jgi:hypothetical protein